MARSSGLRVSGKFSKAEVRRQTNLALRERARETLRTAKAAIATARARRKAAVKEARERCKSERLAAADRARALRLRLLDEMRAAVKAERTAARHACDVRISDARGLRSEIARAREQYAAERQYQRDLRRIEAGNKKTLAQFVREQRRAARSESDDEVRSNIPPDLIALFNRVKRQIRGSDRRSRTEAFLEYAEQHPDEAIEAIEDVSDRQMAKLQAAADKAKRDYDRAFSRPLTAPSAGSYILDEYDDGIPF